MIYKDWYALISHQTALNVIFNSFSIFTRTFLLELLVEDLLETLGTNISL